MAVRDLYNKIQNLFASKESQTFAGGRQPQGRLLFLFPGAHGFWPGIGQGLYRTERIFRDTVWQCNKVVADRFKLIDYFENNLSEELINSGLLHSPILHAVIHIALSELWLAKGVEPHGTIGCSIGEVTSCYVNRSLGLEDILRCASFPRCDPGRIFSKAKLFAVQHNAQVLDRLYKECPVQVFTCAEFGPTFNVYGCFPEDLGTVLSVLEENNIAYYSFSGDYGLHMPLQEGGMEIFFQELGELAPEKARYDFYSNLSGAQNPEGVSLDTTYMYWLSVKPARFTAAIRQAIMDGYDTILSIGASSIILPQIQQLSAEMETELTILDSMRSDEPEEDTFEKTFYTLADLGLVKSRRHRQASNLEFKDQKHITPQTADLQSSEFIQNPYLYYESLRQNGSVHFLSKHGCWIVLDYDDVQSALRQPQLFSSRDQSVIPILVGSDPPAHTDIRQNIQSFFSGRELLHVQGYIEECARRLLQASTSGKNEFDLVNDYAVPLADLVMGRCLDLKEADVAALKQCIGKSGSDHTEAIENFFVSYLNNGEACSRNRIADALITGAGGKKFTPDEIASLLKLFWLAGTTTVSTLISSAAFVLLHHHVVAYEVRSKTDLLPQFIEEVLRFETPEQTARRITLEETVVSGVTIPRGAQVRLCVGAANRDPKKFARPDLFILGRNPKEHIAFGAGPHYCLGAALARMEALAAIEALLTAFPNMCPVESHRAARYVRLSDHSRSLEKLLVRV